MRFRDSFFDEESGKSMTVVTHLRKIFFGEAWLHPDDEPSKFAGCRLAELRAEAKALRYEYNKLREESEACNRLLNDCMNTKKFDKDSPTAKVIFRQVNIRIRNVNKQADKVNAKLEEIEGSIRQRDVVTKAIENRKAKSS